MLTAGHSFRTESQALKNEFQRTGPPMHLLLHYTEALTTQTAQTAVCNRRHSLDQRLCSWLRLSLDRVSGDDIAVTQETLAYLLGVHREGVTETAPKLQELGLIQYRRSRIVVLDLSGLEQRACECYSAVRREYDRLLGDWPATKTAAQQRAGHVGAVRPLCSVAH